MKYTYKERIVLAQKLEIFLALIFAVGLFFIGNVIIDKTFAEDNEYGTATITFNSGADGEFEDGTTTNVVTYNLTNIMTKYSHTSNVLDDGTQNGNYSVRLNTNEVVTLDGASNIHVKITYGGESRDYVCVWEGNYPDYRAAYDYSTSISGKLGGGNHTNSSNTKEYDIAGDSVTFGFNSDGSGYGDGYGYYAIITGERSDGSLLLGNIVSGEYKEPVPYDAEAVFDDWDTSLNTISSSTSVNAVYKDTIASGTYDNVDWRITGTNVLLIGKAGETQTYANSTSRSGQSWPWYQYRESITAVDFIGPVNGNGSHNGMFYKFECANTMNLSNFDTTNINKMVNMFSYCTKITELDLSNFNTSNVTTMEGMFEHCGKLASLDLSSFDTSNVTTMRYAFNSTALLDTLKLGTNFRFLSNNGLEKSWMRDGDSTVYTAAELTSLYDGSTMAGIYRNANHYAIIYENGEMVFQRGRVADESKGEVLGVYTEFDVKNYEAINRVPWLSNKSKVQKIIFTADLSPKTTTYWFYGMPNLTEVVGIENLDTRNVTDMCGMFGNCSALVNLDVSNFDTGNVIKMVSVFSGCSSLTNLDVSNFDTSNVTNMASMFNGCSSLTNLNLNNFDTSQVTDMASMFSGCGSLTSLNLSNFNTSQVTDMQTMFSGCNSLINLNLSSFNIEQVKQIRSMFSGCSALTTLNIDNFGLSQVTNTEFMFYDCSSLLSLTLSNFDTSNVTSMYNMFNGCSSLTSLDVSNFDTSNVTNMDSMFEGCSGLTSLDVTNFDTTNVTDMWGMFSNCSSLVNLDVSGFNTENVTKMLAMFSGCSSLRNLDVSSFNTSNVTDMSYMFSNCSSLTSLDISGFNTGKATDTSGMFKGCRSLKYLDLTNFKNNYHNFVAGLVNTDSLRTLVIGTATNRFEYNSGDNNTLVDNKYWLRTRDSNIWDSRSFCHAIASYNGGREAGTYIAVYKLNISEEVRGDAADVNKDFTFNINVIDEDVGVNGTFPYKGDKTGNVEFVDGDATFTLKHGQSIDLYLPIHSTYSIMQQNDGYTVAKSNDSGILTDSMSASFTDTLNGSTPTGIILNFIPYILLLLMSIGGIFVIRKNNI